MSEYYIPAGPGEAEFVEKRSRFLGHVRFVETEDEARAFVAQVKKEHYDARHNCWCYILPGGTERYSDDGEPQGSAGLPMLEVFRREGITKVVCVVTRYFGGVLLGTGGLLRAYTKSAKDALDAAGVSVVRPWVQGDVNCSYAIAERLKQELLAMNGLVADTEYGADICIKTLVPEENWEAFCARIFDVSAGTVRPTETGKAHRAVRIK